MQTREKKESENQRVSMGEKGKEMVIVDEELPPNINVPIPLMSFFRRLRLNKKDREFEKFV